MPYILVEILARGTPITRGPGLSMVFWNSPGTWELNLPLSTVGQMADSEATCSERLYNGNSSKMEKQQTQRQSIWAFFPVCLKIVAIPSYSLFGVY
jgi:hypothetical protein